MRDTRGTGQGSAFRVDSVEPTTGAGWLSVADTHGTVLSVAVDDVVGALRSLSETGTAPSVDPRLRLVVTGRSRVRVAVELDGVLIVEGPPTLEATLGRVLERATNRARAC